MDWERLANKQYELEYKPQHHLNSKNVDLSNFDTRFTAQQINLKEVEGDTSEVIDAKMFEGFELDSVLTSKQEAQNCNAGAKDISAGDCESKNTEMQQENAKAQCEQECVV